MIKKMLFLRKAILAFLLITFFCFFSNNVNAANFNYADFDWDTFVKQNPDYWAGFCINDYENCKDEVLLTKKKFYIRLYELLAEYQKKGYMINDNYIIETVFFGLTPDSFRDKDDNNDNFGVYNIEEEELGKESFKYIASDDGNIELAKKYFESETDSLKTLLNNMIGYKQKCYGNTTGKIITDEEGNKSCDDGSIPYGEKCVDLIDNLKASFWDKLGINNIFGQSENQKKCDELGKEKKYDSVFLGDTTDKPELDIEFYWKFLKETDYFDNKPQLQKYFNIVLSKANKKSMTDPAWGATKEEQNENKLKYKEDIEEARQSIIDLIRDILEKYEEIYGTSISMKQISSSSYWWPIGSSETTQDGDIVMAAGEPSSTHISSQFGMRTYPKTGMHYGIDIAGVVNETNIIAVRDGVVSKSSVSDGIVCPDSTNPYDECGTGLGNYLVIQHSDGNYTVYGHMEANTVTLKIGDSVKQGQFIGKIGSSGSSTGGHLHFEIRVGGSSNTYSVDPLTFISVETPRASVSSSEMLTMLHNLEGSGEISGNSYVVYNDGTGTLTVGHGVAIKYHLDKFKQLGYDASGVGVGTLISIDIVDKVEQQIVQGRVDSINSALANAGLNLNQNQIDALVIRSYNYYDIEKFIVAYKSYGDTQALYDNFLCKPVTGVNVGYMAGLEKRRKLEWKLFHEGVYS